MNKGLLKILSFVLIAITISCCISFLNLKVYGVTNITSAKISSTDVKTPVSGQKMYIPNIAINSVTPNSAAGNVQTEAYWYHDGETIFSEDIESNNLKFESGDYCLYVSIDVIDSQKNLMDYEKFPDTIKLNNFEFSVSGRSFYYVLYEKWFYVEAKDGTKPTIKTDYLEDGKKGLDYSFQLNGWGSGTINWALAKDNKLPNGLKLSSKGIISGKPTVYGTYTFSVVASNKYGTATKKYTLNISDTTIVTSAKISSTQIHKPTIGEKIYFPKVNIDSKNPSSAKLQINTFWEHNGEFIYENDVKEKNIKFEAGAYIFYVYIEVEDSSTTIVNYDKFSDTIKLNNINFRKNAVCDYYVGYSTDFVVIPAQVKNVKVTSQKEKEISISWSKNSGSVAGYKIYTYDYEKKKYKFVGKTTNTKYTLKNLKSGSTYKIKVNAYITVDGKDYGSKDLIITTVTKPSKPTIKSATTKNNSVTLKWNRVTGSTGYEIWMSTEKTKGYKKITTITKASTLSYTKKSLSKNKTYYFKIKAYKTIDGKKVYGAYSDIKQIKVK